ncbi:flagellar export protein FliJ [Idiomarina tyrosinivorans]|uniref:Flagellar FliJ protein n=1 Tax=Idiomarina tyrosinivorans TaxID=1445662 RepID=A0A432ZSP0_9GAMM|nr:flagellar export protein FliJ [Idiomarina tyrosinivorans]RUO80882.1 flagellar export protein FliJ [Idiomarina tyrosinivorans]
MAEIRQLKMVEELEQRREDQAAQRFAQAQMQLQQQQQQLQGMEQYRYDYLRQLQNRGSQGIGSLNFGQYHAFVGKLDEGVEQLHGELQTLQQVVEQRRQQWLEQRRKTESIRYLIEQREKQEAQAVARKEQKNLDDFSSQRFIRNKKAAKS